MTPYEEDARAIRELSRGFELLLVEDEPLILERLGHFFGKFFDTVHTAQDAASALQIYRARHAEGASLLLMTDINLGTISGIELTTQIKQIAPDQRVIAVSGTDDRTVFVDAIRCGVDRFILKPINFNELTDALKSVLKAMAQEEELEQNRRLLEESRRYALQLLDEQDEFLKNAIHEMHTPLSVIITNIDLMRMEKMGCESLDAIEAASRIIQNSYQDMTYLMKRDHTRDRKEAIDVVAFIRERIRYFRCIADVSRIVVNLQVGQPKIPELLFSTLKFGRIVDNTLSNALKYSYHPGQVDVIVGMRKGSVFLEVRNRGPVIRDKEKIFERFYREERHKGGYGLGLHIVGQICREEAVEVTIASSEKKGTSFSYTFPPATQMPH